VDLPLDDEWRGRGAVGWLQRGLEVQLPQRSSRALTSMR